jgi:sugar phosphate isomerase/epimerase
MRSISRRDWLKRGILSSGAIMAWTKWPAIEVLGAAAPTVAGPDVKFPAAPRERLAVASWPFRANIESPTNTYRDKKQPGMDIADFAARVKKDFQVPGVEPLSAHFPATDERYLAKFRAAIENAGVHVVNIPVDNRHSYYDADKGGRKKAVDWGKHWVDVAVLIGAPSIRSSIAQAKNAKPDANVVAEQLKQLTEYAATKNIVVNLENDDLVSEDAFFIVKVIEKVNHPYLHALPDFCNSMASGNEKFNYDALTALFPLAYNNCHVKDSEVGDDGNVFRVDMKKTFGILRASGYRGYCSMEWEGAGDPYAGTRFLIKSSLENLG